MESRSKIVIDCGDPQNNLTMLNMATNSGSPLFQTKYLSTTEVVCLMGYKFFDGSETNQMNCTVSGSWNSYPSCVGNIKLSLIMDH